MVDMKNRSFVLGLLLILALSTALSGCGQKAAFTPDYWPTEGWKTASPESQGMDSDILNNLFTEIESQGLDIHSLLIVRNGYLVADAYYYPYQKEYRHLLNSVTKSFTSALVGLSIGDGTIKNVNQKVLEILSDTSFENTDNRKKSLTLKHFLTMTTGLDWNETGAYGSSGDSNTQMQRSENQVKFVLDKPVKADPGSSFYYNTGASQVLSAIVQKASGKTSFDYLTSRVLTPLGISDISWRVDGKGIYSGGGGMFMRPGDLAKYGFLYLNNGKWEDEQIISEAWVKESTKKQVETPSGLAGRYGYGYHWWMNSFGGYSARGFSGQYLFVVPDANLVVVFTGGLDSSDFFEPERLVGNYILPAIQSPGAISENPKALNKLTETLETIQKASASEPVLELPETVRSLSGKTYRMDTGETFSFDFREASECTMGWFCDGEQYEVKIGLDGIYRVNDMNAFYWPGMVTKVGFKGYWEDEQTFRVEMLPLEDSNSYLFQFDFDGITLHSKLSSRLINAPATEGTGTCQ